MTSKTTQANWFVVACAKSARTKANNYQHTSETIVSSHSTHEGAIAAHRPLAKQTPSLGMSLLDRDLAVDALPDGTVLHYHVIHRSAHPGLGA